MACVPTTPGPLRHRQVLIVFSGLMAVLLTVGKYVLRVLL